MRITQRRLAMEIDVSPQRIGDIIGGRRSITANTDLLLCLFFELSDGYRLRAQVSHDTEVALAALSEKIASITPWSAAS